MIFKSRTHVFSLCLSLAGALLALSPAARAWPGVPPTVMQDPSLPRVVLNGHVFHAQHFGEPGRPVLIVLHGGPGADHRYLLGLQALADRYQVVFYDQRGTGLSARVSVDDLGVQTFIDDLDAFVDAYGQGQPVHLLGHSWGAMLASAYTGRHPHKVKRLVLAEPGFLDAATADVLLHDGLPAWRQLWGTTTAWLGQWWVRTDGDPHARDDWFYGQVLPLTQGPEQMCPGGPPALQAWRFGYASFQATAGRMMRDPAFVQSLNFHQGVQAHTGQTLFLAGACNQRLGETQQRRLMAYFRQARLQVIPGAGHYMFNDQPALSLAAVRAFLDGEGP